MRSYAHWVPTGVTIAAGFALRLHGPIPQFADYHAFADQRTLFGVPHAMDVLSNAGFAIVGIGGLVYTGAGSGNKHRPGQTARLVFLVALVLTAIGSAFYHLAPDNARLLWDRLPIALGCAGLLAAVRADTRTSVQTDIFLAVLIAAAVGSVWWWWITDHAGEGDLGPYLLLQAMPLILIPLWQAIHGAPGRTRLAFGLAILLYVVAKIAELNDRALFTLTGAISGHTLKHLLATAAAAVLVWAHTMKIHKSEFTKKVMHSGSARL